MNKEALPIAYLRNLTRTTQCELRFDLKVTHPKYGALQEEIKAVRQLKDDVASLLNHTKNKIVKLYQDNCKINIEADEFKEEMHISLTRNDVEFPSTTSCDELLNFKRKIRLDIFDSTYRIIINAPLIHELTLPIFIYTKSCVKPLRLKGIYLHRNLCRFTWSKSKDRVNWVNIFYDHQYRVTEEDLDYYLKLTCVPFSHIGTEGPTVEVVSENVVCVLPETPCPLMEYRREFAKEKLKGRSIRVVTYNTLAERYTEDSQFHYCDPGFLSIGYRKQLIWQELMGYKADIICLQEIDIEHYGAFFKKQFRDNNYKSCCFKKGNMIQEGLSLAFDSKRFRKIDVKHIVLAHEAPKKPYQAIWNLIKKRKEVRALFMKQHTSLLVAVLKSIETADILIVANTHLYYHCEAGHIRVLQIAVALKYIKDLCQVTKRMDPGKISVIFCGDFNSRPDTAVYHYLSQGSLANCSENLENIGGCTSNVYQHDFNFVSACGTPEFTNYTEDFQGCLDYIFCETDVRILQQSPFPPEEDLKKDTALPNSNFPSDHIAVVADLKY